MRRAKGFLQRVKWTRADVAENDANGGERKRVQWLFMIVRVSRVSHKSDISVQSGKKRTPFYLTLHAKTPSRVLLERHERRV
jgi:hypothetical protein